MPGLDTNIGAKRARKARAALGIGAAEPLECVLTTVEVDAGVPVVIAPLPGGLAGCCWREGNRTVIWVNGNHIPVRQRFTLAHELGHVRCEHDISVQVDTFETLGGKTTDAREVQANAFAAEFLAPAAGIREMLDGEPTLEDVVRIAARFRISTIAALYRLNTLELTRRSKGLEAAVRAGEDVLVWEELALPSVDDEIARTLGVPLPRLSPAIAGSALRALVDGSASVEQAARAATCDPGRLASGIELIRS